LVYGLKSSDFDLLIAGAGSYRGVEGLNCQDLRNFRVSVLVRSEHPLAQLKGIAFTELTIYPLISSTELSANHPIFSKLPILRELNTSVLCSDNQVLRQILLDTDAWMAAPEQQFREDLASGTLVVLDVQGWALTTELCAIELVGRSRSPAAQRFVELCQSKLTAMD
jgi:DNA-binding transcriptional LysR family regulator